MIRIIAKLFAVTVVLTALLAVAPVRAQTQTAYVSATGGSGTCTQTVPCASIAQAVMALTGAGSGRIVCVTPVTQNDGFDFNAVTLAFDCPLTSWAGEAGSLSGSNSVLKFQHIDFNGFGLQFAGSGTLIFEDCVFENNNSTALQLEPTGALNLVMTNSRISNSPSGVLIEPGSGGSVNARFDRVTITQNSGGGIKTNTANGPVTVDIIDSVVSDNAGNGINAVAGASQNIISIKNSVIAGNGVAGVQSNGVNAGVLISTTLLDQNAAGATSVVGGGNMFTYGNNDIVGTMGSGFTGTATLH
jgi:hypothetical protein